MTDRPLSPHLQIYRPQLTSMLSILHRITGVGLSLGLLMLTWFLLALAGGPDRFETFREFCGSFFGVIFLMGFDAAASYHLCSGIRHLIFDTGRLMDLTSAYRAGYVVLGAAALLTLILWIKGF